MKTKDLIKPMIMSGCLVFLLCYLIEKPTAWDDYTSYMGYAVTAVTTLFVLYERWLWKHIPWKRPPVLKKRYNGTLSYSEKGQNKTKTLDIRVSQTLHSIRVETNTDINASYTITASIEEEYGNFFLYYTYITNPDASVQKGNPVQHGTCRMLLQKDTSIIKGKYWTTSKTVGDLLWQEKNE